MRPPLRSVSRLGGSAVPSNVDPSREFREAGFQIPNGIAAEMGRYRQECHCNLGQVLR
jgi:hypothetical protein